MKVFKSSRAHNLPSPLSLCCWTGKKVSVLSFPRLGGWRRVHCFRRGKFSSCPIRACSTWFGSARLGSARLGSALLCFARFGSVRFGSVRFGSARLGSVRCGAVRFDAVRSGSVRSGPVRSGSVRFGAVRCGSSLSPAPRLVGLHVAVRQSSRDTGLRGHGFYRPSSLFLFLYARLNWNQDPHGRVYAARRVFGRGR